MSRFVVDSIASGLGSGYAKRMPGTFGSLAAVGLWIAVEFFSPGMLSDFKWPVTICFAIVGFLVAKKILQRDNREELADLDPQWIVIDEWAGMWVTLSLASVISLTFVDLIVPFALFRFFDASKIGPVGAAETLPGAYGIMADDIVAGLLAGLSSLAILSIFTSIT